MLTMGYYQISNQEKLKHDALLNNALNALDRINAKINIPEANGGKYGYDEVVHSLYVSANRFSRGFYGQTTENTTNKIKEEFSQIINTEIECMLENITQLSCVSEGDLANIIARIEMVKLGFLQFCNRIGSSEKGEEILPAAKLLQTNCETIFNLSIQQLMQANKKFIAERTCSKAEIISLDYSEPECDELLKILEFILDNHFDLNWNFKFLILNSKNQNKILKESAQKAQEKIKMFNEHLQSFHEKLPYEVQMIIEKCQIEEILNWPWKMEGIIIEGRLKGFMGLFEFLNKYHDNFDREENKNFMTSHQNLRISGDELKKFLGEYREWQKRCPYLIEKLAKAYDHEAYL